MRTLGLTAYSKNSWFKRLAYAPLHKTRHDMGCNTAWIQADTLDVVLRYWTFLRVFVVWWLRAWGLGLRDSNLSSQGVRLCGLEGSEGLGP